MKIKKMKQSLMLGVLLLGAATVAQAGSKPSNMFMIHDTAKSPMQVVASIKHYSKAHKWLFIGATKVRKGTVTLVKVCIPKIGKHVWPQGLYLSALLPCGNVGIYKHKGKTQVSMLSADYMYKLEPTMTMKKVSNMAKPMLKGLMMAAIK